VRRIGESFGGGICDLRWCFPSLPLFSRVIHIRRPSTPTPVPGDYRRPQLIMAGTTAGALRIGDLDHLGGHGLNVTRTRSLGTADTRLH
jgi:hypothetical protein